MPDEELKETGYGTIKACYNVLNSIERMGYGVKLNVCKKKKIWGILPIENQARLF
ncbi:MAG: hypothetical protein O6852_01970 [Gammaproteobacteria bacterium]|nr:hypothetical protein [Gammaproteobacteria bacterium]